MKRMKEGGVREFTVRLPEEMAEVLRNYAFAANVSVNEVFKRSVATFLSTHGRREAIEKAFQRVLEDHAVALDKLKDL